MSDADFELDNLMDDATNVSFVVVEGERASRPPLPPLVATCIGGLQSGVQGKTSKGKSYSVVSITSSDHPVCFGDVGKGCGWFSIRKNCWSARILTQKSRFKEK
jgi:hypothetical protein